MINIKSYNHFCNESKIKNFLAGAASAGSLSTGMISCDSPNQNSNQGIQKLADATHIDIPNSFKLDQKLITIGMDMNIISNGNNIGIIEERTISIGKKFEYYDNLKKLVTSAHQKVFSLYTQIEIFDENKKLIGTVEQEVIESFFSIYSIYSIKNADGVIIAKSKKLDFFTTNVDIYDTNNKLLVKMHKRFITMFGDTWDVNILGNIDKRLIIFIPAFISSSQAEKEKDDDDDNDDN